MKFTYASTFFVALGLVVSGAACNDDATNNESETGTETGDAEGDGDGDGDGDEGDGDGDGDEGDGDGDEGDGDGDEGDGDGDEGDGDGDEGDGDGDEGDGDGDGDPDPGVHTIYELQDGTVPSDTPVIVNGVWVTAVSNNGFFAQELDGGQNSGIWVYVAEGGPDFSEIEIGDLVDLEGVVTEFNSITELDITNGSVDEIGVADPIPELDVITMADLEAEVGEPWESVLVRIENDPITVVSLPGFDEFIVNDGSADGFVDNYLYNLISDGEEDFPSFGIGATFTAIQGPVNFSFDNFKIAPRFPADLEGYLPSESSALGINDLVPGDLVITEIMYNPAACASQDPCEWIELYNASGEPVDLDGLRIRDHQDQTGQIQETVIVEPDSYVWLGRNSTDWPYSNPAAGYYGPNPALNNGSSERVLILNDSDDDPIDETHIFNNPTAAGVSLQLDAGSIDATANDSASNWCASTVDFGDGDLGSPGEANEPCL